MKQMPCANCGKTTPAKQMHYVGAEDVAPVCGACA